MIFSNRHCKIVTILLLLVQMCLPLSGPLYISTNVSSIEKSLTETACLHADADTDHQSKDGREQIPHCHELDAPCDTVSGALIKHSPLISKLTASHSGAFLPGYGAPLEIPPKNIV
ncbi:MAG: hypothetical protein PHD54_15815 [Desulfuromonadaceae bacterium]|nr:hypothetical protein [Desulfuromonadaceae bacterium]